MQSILMLFGPHYKAYYANFRAVIYQIVAPLGTPLRPSIIAQKWPLVTTKTHSFSFLCAFSEQHFRADLM